MADTRKFIVVMDIKFTGGTLVGLTSRQRVPFASEAAAKEFATAMDGAKISRPVAGSPYVVTATSIEKRA